MSLTAEQFETCAKYFLRVSELLHDTWEWHRPYPGLPGYLKKPFVLRACNLQRLDNSANKKTSLDSSEDTTIASESQSWHIYEYHITYSPSFSVPVLYFNAQTQDHRPLTPEEIWEDISERYRHDDLRWTFVTQADPFQDHPILSIPFYHIHPCQTANFMSRCHAASSTSSSTTSASPHPSYLITWLSLVGPVAGLHLPLAYFTAAEQSAKDS